MAKLLRLLIVFTLIFSTAVGCDAAKKTLAVMTIENVSYPEVSAIMADNLLVAFGTSGRFTLVERENLGAILREQGFQSLMVSPERAVEVGNLAGAQYTLINKVISAACYYNESNVLSQSFGQLLSGFADSGLVSRNYTSILAPKQGFTLVNTHKGKVAIECRLIDNASGVVAFSTMVQGTKSGRSVADAIHGACREAAQNAIKALERENPFSARIADYADNKIYIDAGFDSGLKVGDKLLIVREGHPIEIDGRIVGVTESDVGRAKVIEVNGEYSVCRVLKHDDKICKGDIVKREK